MALRQLIGMRGPKAGSVVLRDVPCILSNRGHFLLKRMMIFFAQWIMTKRQERESILRVNTEFKIKLDDHPYAEHLPPRAVMLAKVR